MCAHKLSSSAEKEVKKQKKNFVPCSMARNGKCRGKIGKEKFALIDPEIKKARTFLVGAP